MTSPYRIVALDRVTSTNDEAAARLRAGEPGGFVVTARAQTSGRGRQGRNWASPPGNLYLSLALRDPAAPAQAPQLGFVAGVALAKALRTRVADGASVKLKWPNDVLCGGAKLAGMLLESMTLPGGGFGCVVGIGVNCRSHPVAAGYATTDLEAAGARDAAPESLLADFLTAFDAQFRIWDGGAGFGTIRASWLATAAGLGAPIGVTTPRRQLAGIFRDLDATGRLLLDTADGIVAVEAGDVFFPALAAADG